MSKRALAALSALVAAAACSDSASSTSPTSAAANVALAIHAPAPERYVAIGTSISMGWASNGVYDGSQILSWPELLAFGSLHPMSLPLIQSPGCISPILAPLGRGVRLSGESITGSAVCAPNVAGVTLPTQNVALASALAADAVETTPEDVATTYPWFARVLPPGTTAVAAALAQHPTIVSVELGGNEALGATSGLVAFGVTVVPLPFFTAPYDAVLDAVGSTGAKAVLAGLPSDGRNLPLLRRADEIWADRAEFAALHVDVGSDCATSPNYINVAIQSLNMVFAGAFTSSHGLPNPVYSCTDVPGTADLILTPADIAVLNGLLGQMTAHIKQQATARGYGYFSLGALYDRADLKPAHYSVVSQLTSLFPYGPFISLDGVHPNVAGNVVLALAAAGAINQHYGPSLARAVPPPSGGPSLALEVVTTPSQALEQARSIAMQHSGETLAPCSMPGGCVLKPARGGP